jgi:HK97 family phage portal protein
MGFVKDNSGLLIPEELATIKKDTLNSTLAGIVGNQFITLTTRKYDNTYITNYIIHRCINILAENGAKLPMRLYHNGKLMDEGFIIPQHGGFNLQKPHPKMSMNQLLYEGLVYKYYRGELMFFIDLEGRLTLEPINPKLMKIKTKDRLGNVETWRWNRKLDIKTEELIYDKIFNPDDLRGVSLVDIIKDEIINDDTAREFNTKFFENFGKVGGMLYDDKGEITATAMNALVTMFNQAHAGSEKAHQTLGLPSGIKYQEAQQTMREMDFRGSRDDIRDRILSLFGIHKSVFGVTDKVDRAVADAAKAQLWTETLQPAMLGIQECFNTQLFTPYFPGYKCKFDFSDVTVLQESQTEILTRAKVYHELGYSTNEINQLLGLGMDDITDLVGDMRFVPSALIPVDELTMESISEPAPKKTIDKVVDILSKPETKKISSRSYKRKYDRMNRALQKEINSKFGRHISAQLGKILAIVNTSKYFSAPEEKIVKINTTKLLLSIQRLLVTERKVLRDLMEPLFKDGSLTMSKLTLDILDIEETPKISKTAVNKSLSRITGINNYTYRLLKRQIKGSVTAGETIAEMSKRIQNVYKFGKSRARTISRTESCQVLNNTAMSGYKKHDVKKKQWIGGTRESHAAQDGMIIGINKAFPNNCKFPGDPAGGPEEVCNCRCAICAVI